MLHWQLFLAEAPTAPGGWPLTGGILLPGPMSPRWNRELRARLEDFHALIRHGARASDFQLPAAWVAGCMLDRAASRHCPFEDPCAAAVAEIERCPSEPRVRGFHRAIAAGMWPDWPDLVRCGSFLRERGVAAGPAELVDDDNRQWLRRFGAARALGSCYAVGAADVSGDGDGGFDSFGGRVQAVFETALRVLREPAPLPMRLVFAHLGQPELPPAARMARPLVGLDTLDAIVRDAERAPPLAPAGRRDERVRIYPHYPRAREQAPAGFHLADVVAHRLGWTLRADPSWGDVGARAAQVVILPVEALWPAVPAAGEQPTVSATGTVGTPDPDAPPPRWATEVAARHKAAAALGRAPWRAGGAA